jgi:hypothetical protein
MTGALTIALDELAQVLVREGDRLGASSSGAEGDLDVAALA